MTDRLCVRPAGDQRVLKPNGEWLGAAGELVPATSYWRRRLAAGEVEVVEVDKPKSSKPKE